MTFDTRGLHGRLNQAALKIRARLDQLQREWIELHEEMPADVLRQEARLRLETDSLQSRLNRIHDRQYLLIAYDWQKAHGFPLLKEVEACSTD